MTERYENVLRYLGYRSVDNHDVFIEQITDLFDEMVKDSVPRNIYGIYDLELKDKWVSMGKGTVAFNSGHLAGHLAGCRECAVVAVTLGALVDRKISYYQNVDMSKAVIYNACANVYVEEVLSSAAVQIRKDAGALQSTFPFSPGYGDLGLEVQKEIIELLQTKKSIGLYVNESCLLIPEKSITAVIGLK